MSPDPKDLVSIHFQLTGEVNESHDLIIDEIVMRIATKLDSL
jgi:hypothetical protein